MPFDRPTYLEILDRIQGDVESRITGSNAHLRHTVEGVLARVLSGASHGMYGHSAYSAKQMFPQTAELEWLLKQASLVGLTRKAAVKAQGDASITGVTLTVIPAGSELSRSDGELFTTDAAVTVTAGVATLALTASEAGADGNTDAGTSLTFSTPISGVSVAATVDSGGIVDGEDIETTEDLRARVLYRWQNPPSGGGPNDYVNWALEVTSVTRAWSYPLIDGVGSVGVTFVLDNTSPIIPGTSKVTEVETYIRSVCPVDLDDDGLIVFAPTGIDFDLTISITPDTATIRTAVEAQIADLLDRKGEPGGTIYLSQINEAISLAAGEEDHTLTSPVANVTHAWDEIPVVGTITWV